MDEEWKAAMAPWKERLGSLEGKARRRTVEQVYSFLRGEEDDSEHEQRLPVRSRKLRSFSGSKYVKQGEVDFATWRLHALSLVEDDILREAEKKRVLCESLLSPALEVACTLDVTSTSSELLYVLEQHFGDVADGFELYSQFRAAVQGMQETASEYLHRLHVLAMKAVDKKGMSGSSVPREVTRQFENNCADDDLLLRVGVMDMISAPPAVADLLHAVRTEECRRHQKKFRLKARTARANVVTACEEGFAAQMTAQMATLQDQFRTLTLQIQSQGASNAVDGVSQPQRLQPQQPQPQRLQPQIQSRGSWRGRGQRGRGSAARPFRFGFCFNCGQDGHYQVDCTNSRNADFLQQRLVSASTSPGAQAASPQGNE